MTAGRQRLRMEDLAGLELFVSAVRLGSISAAAREHDISQPSATEKLRTLERRLSMKLLDRGPGGSAATPAGEAITQWAQHVLVAVDRMSAGVAAMSSRDAQHPLRIMASLTIAEYVMPRWLHTLRSAGARPIDLAVGNSERVIRAVEAAEVELGFIETRRLTTGLRSIDVGGDTLCVVVGPGHAWARRRGLITPQLLEQTPLLLREQGSGTRDALESAMAESGCDAPRALTIMASTTTLKSACAAGDGISVLSELAVAHDLAAGTLVALPTINLDLRRQFRAIWRPDVVSADAERFVRTCRSLSSNVDPATPPSIYPRN